MNVLRKLVKAKNCLLAVLVLSAALCAQSYQPYQNPKVQLFDNNGAPAAGFSLCTFAAGTTTPQATYADNAGTVNPNPVVLDSAGRATVYLGAFSYKFILYAANGTGCPNSASLIWSQDNIYNLEQISGAVLLNPGVGVSQSIAQPSSTTFEVAVNGGASLTVGPTVAVAGTLAVAGPQTVTNTGVFTNTQMNLYHQSLINACSPLTEFQNTQGANNYSTDAGTFCTDVPSSSTVFQGQALSAYVNNQSTTTAAVPLYTVANCAANNTNCWGANLVSIMKAGVTGATVRGLEIDFGGHEPNPANYGLMVGVTANISGELVGSVTGSYGFGVGKDTPTAAQVDYGFFTQDGITNRAGIFLGATAATGTVNSQPVTFKALLSGSPATSSIAGDGSGNLQLIPATGHSANLFGGLAFVGEASSPPAGSTASTCYSDSTASYVEKCSFAGDSFSQLARLGAAQTWTAAQTHSAGVISNFFQSSGTAATLTGTGACATRSNQLGGATAGEAKCTGTTGASTLIITTGITATNGWSCWGSDITHTLAGSQSVASATAPVLTFTSVTANDTLTFGCVAY